MIYFRSDCARNGCQNKNRELSCNNDDWNIQRLCLLACRFQFHVCELIKSFEIPTFFCYIVTFLWYILVVGVCVMNVGIKNRELSCSNDDWNIQRTCLFARRIQFYVCEVLKSFEISTLFCCSDDFFFSISASWLHVRGIGVKNKIAKYLSVLIIEIFRGHVCLHVGSVFMFVNLWKDLKFRLCSVIMWAFCDIFSLWVSCVMNVGIKIVSYLVVMTIEIFRGHVCLHVDFKFMFVKA